MTRKEYLYEIGKCKLSNNKVNIVEKKYGKEIPDIIKQVISYADDSIFFDDGWRVLALSEIIGAEQDLHVEFVSLGIIPIADCSENDFIVYHLRDRVWSKFNITDEIAFKKKATLEELFI